MKNKNKKISTSLKKYYYREKRLKKTNQILASIILLIGLLTATGVATAHIRQEIAIKNTTHIELQRCNNGTHATDCSLVELGGVADGVAPTSLSTPTVSPQREAGEVITDDTASVAGITVEQQIRNIAEEQNFKWVDYLIRLAYCESRLDPNAYNPTNNSHDRGIFQISRKWHPEVSDICAYDIRCSTEWTMQRINAGYQHEWVCDRLI